ncbi:sugar kinase [Halomarina litorea]|uniref:sugar kinase n=1 Tax=Halomarina litorea TaxID=2961595 RepID=UPI0020C231F5|nr:sugar kinase [Halomarina sp. BCD28]
MTLVTFGEASLHLAAPDRERLVTADGLRVHVDGAESNAAVAAARLGVESVWLSKLPDSPLGRRIAGTLRGHGLDADVVWADGGERQGVRYFERGSDPRPDVTVDDAAGAAVTRLAPEDLSVDRLRGAGAFYTTAATMALSRDLVRTCATLLATASNAGVRTAFGLGPRGRWSPEAARETVRDLFSDVDVLVARESDVRAVLGRDGTARELAHALATAHDFERVALTRGDRGGVLWEDATCHQRAATETRVVDPTGAADAFAGVVLARTMAGAGAAETLADAVAAETLARTVPGPLSTATAADIAEVVARMDDERDRRSQ